MPVLQRERQRKRSREDGPNSRSVDYTHRYRPTVREAFRTVLVAGQANRHAAWRLDRQQRRINGRHHLLRNLLKRLLTILDGNLEQDALCWSTSGADGENGSQYCTIRLVDQAFDDAAIGIKYGLQWHGTAVSAQVLVRLLVKRCGFVETAANQHNVPRLRPIATMTTTTIHELSHRHFCPGRVDLLARIRFGGNKNNDISRQQDDKNDNPSMSNIQWPSGTRANSVVHLADERQYRSILTKSPDQLWPEPLDDDYNDGDDDDDVSLDDDELDATWDREVSDGIDPIRFGTDQLTQVLSSSCHKNPATRAEQRERDDDGDDDTKTNDDAAMQRSRILLLQSCWERAVHMANAAFTVETTTGTTKASSTRSDDDETHQGQPPQQQPPPSRSSNSGIASTVSPPLLPSPLPVIRSRSVAEHACRRWNLRPRRLDDGTADDHDDDHTSSYVCSVCRNVYATRDQLERHFFGSSSSSSSTTATEGGCCWLGISHERRQFIRRVLCREIDVQRRQLLSHLLSNPPNNTSNDAFGILDTLDATFRNSSQVVTAVELSASAATGSSTRRPIASETLQLSATLPPLILNHDVLESARHRIVDRYTTVRR